jgi:hypothetical protein
MPSVRGPQWPGELQCQAVPRPAALLAGAVSQGCHMGLLPHLQTLVAMLLPCLADPEPMVRIIACWSLSRYSHWYTMPDAATQQYSPEQQAVLDAVMASLLKCMLDRNRAVQESACSALANIADDAGGVCWAALPCLWPHWEQDELMAWMPCTGVCIEAPAAVAPMCKLAVVGVHGPAQRTDMAPLHNTAALLYSLWHTTGTPCYAAC